MENSIKIDNIIDDLTKRIAPQNVDKENNDFLTEEQLILKSFLEERRIRYLIHFTDEKNVPSIRENGILSVEQLQQLGLTFKANDEDRYDGELDYISLSVSGMNQYLYKTFRYSKQKIKHGVAIVIDSSILYKEISNLRIYCNTNAANSEATIGMDLESFENLFANVVDYKDRHFDRANEKRSSFEPTDVQAEILWNKCVPTEYIICYWDLEEDFFYGN